MESPLNEILGNELSEVQVEVKRIRPESRYHYDLYDEFGNVILPSQTPISQALIANLLKNGTEFLYYDPSRKVKEETLTVSGLNPDKNIISEELQEEVTEKARDLLAHIRDVFTKSTERRVNPEKIQGVRDVVQKLLVDIDTNQDAVFNPLVKLKEFDDYEYLHATNVSILGAIVGARMEFPLAVRSAMGVGGLFHDIGKTSLSKEIVENYRAIRDEELDVVKEHCHLGYKLIENNPGMQDLEKRIVLLHHERPDGKGYPFGFTLEHFSERVPREVRLMAICNMYARLVTEAPGQEALSSRVALRKMLNMVHAPFKQSSYFLVNDFRDFVRAAGFIVNKGTYFFNVGDVVRLSTGELGVVEDMNKLYPLKPKVRVVTNSALQKLKRQISVNLIQDLNLYIANVIERKNPGA